MTFRKVPECLRLFFLQFLEVPEQRIAARSSGRSLRDAAEDGIRVFAVPDYRSGARGEFRRHRIRRILNDGTVVAEGTAVIVDDGTAVPDDTIVRKVVEYTVIARAVAVIEDAGF